MSIKVSVILPVYNVETFLEECLNSVFSQTLNEIEVICINDGSTDGSLNILKNYEKANANMILVTIENQGVGNARNLGLKMAKGEMCCFMDPDDKYPSSDVLEVLYNNVKEHNAKICGGSAILLKNGEYIEDVSDNDKKYRFHDDRWIDFKEYQWSYGFWRFMYNRKFLIENDILFPLYSRYQDPPFFVKAMIHAKSFYSLNKATYIYRVNSRKMVYTYEKTRDCLLGMIDILRMTKAENMNELYLGTLTHINTWLCMPLYQNIIKGHADLITLLDIARYEIDQQYSFEVENKLKKYEEIKKEEKEFIKLVNKYKYVIVYGAGYVGKKVGEYLLNIPDRSNIYYAVTDFKEDEASYKGIEIKSIKDYKDIDKENALVLIATMENLHQEIYNYLLELNFKHISKIDYSVFELFYSSIL